MKALLLCCLLAWPARAWQKEKHLYDDVFTPYFTLDAAAGVYRNARAETDPETFSQTKSTAAFRVFLVGATTVHTYHGFQDLEHALKLVLPGMRIEVLRCGLSGYDSYREAIILREVLNYSPDLIVLMGGINELQSLYYPLPPWLSRIEDVYGGPRPRSSQGAARSITEDAGGKEWRPRLDAWLKQNPGPTVENWPARRAGRLEEFRENLRLMIGLAKAKGVRIAVCSPPVNYRDNPPEVPLPWGDAGFTKGWVRYLRGQFKEARKIWSEVKTLKPLVRFYLGRCAEKLGDAKEAVRLYAEAIDAADYRFCGPACAKMMEETARAEGAAWVDLDAAFRRATFPRAPGLDLFLDQNQWKAEAGPIVSAELVAAIHGDARFAALPWDKARLLTVRKDLTEAGEALDPSVSPPPLEYTLHFALWELQSRKKPGDLLWPSLSWLESGFEREPDWFSDTGRLFARIEAKDKRRPPGEKDDGDPADANRLKAQFYWHMGEVRLRRGDFRGALADLDAALVLDPSLSSVRFSRALAQALSGDEPGARKTLADASPESRSLAAALELDARRR